MLRSPKERFLASTYSGQWGKIASSETFDEAIHTALIELQTHMPMDCQVPQQACDSHQQMVGARKFMEILCTLHVKDSSPKPQTTSTLNYSAGV